MSYTHAYNIDPDVLHVDTTPLHSHAFKNRNKSKMVPVKRPELHPLQQNSLMNFWGTVLTSPSAFQGDHPLAMPFAETIVFRNNQTVGWYRWDDTKLRPVCRSHFPIRVPVRTIAAEDGEPVQELDWDGPEVEESNASEDEEEQREEDVDDLEDDEYRDEEGSEPEEQELSDHTSPYHRQMMNIYKRFTLSPAGDEAACPIAVFVADESGDLTEARDSGARQVSLQYLDASGLKHFLATAKPNGVLQRYTPPHQDRHTIIQAVWTPYVVIVERRQNKLSVSDSGYPLRERTLTSVAGGPLTQEVPITSALSEEVERYFAHLSYWLHGQEDNRVLLCRAVSYFTLDRGGRLRLLWPSALEVMPALDPHPQLSHNLRAQAMHVHYLTRNMSPTNLVSSPVHAAASPRKRSPEPTPSAAPEEAQSPHSDPFAHSPRCISCRVSPNLSASFRQWLSLSGEHLPADLLPASGSQPDPSRPQRQPTPDIPASESPLRFTTPYDREKLQTYRQYRRRQDTVDEKRLPAIDRRVSQALRKLAKAEDVMHLADSCPTKGGLRPTSNDTGTAPATAAAARSASPADTAAARPGVGTAPISSQRKRHHLPALALTHPAAPTVSQPRPMKSLSPARDPVKREWRLRRREQGWDGCVRLGRHHAPRPAPQDLFQLYRCSHVPSRGSPGLPSQTTQTVESQWSSRRSRGSDSTTAQTEPEAPGAPEAEEASLCCEQGEDGGAHEQPPETDTHTMVDTELTDPESHNTHMAAMVVILQRVYRGYCVRRQLRKQREEARQQAELEAAEEAKRREAAARCMQWWWRRMGAVWQARRAAASPSTLRGHLSGARYAPRSLLFGATYSERQRRQMGRRGYKTALDMLFAAPPSAKGPLSSHPGPTTLGHGTPSSHWRKTPGAPNTARATRVPTGDFVSPSAASYVAIEARYNNRIALDFIEDVFYEAYSHQLNCKGGLFRFSLPPELGLLRVEIDAMLLGFGVERDPRTPEQIEAEQAALLAAQHPEAKATLKPPHAALQRAAGPAHGHGGPASRRTSAAAPPVATGKGGTVPSHVAATDSTTAKEKLSPEMDLFGLGVEEEDDDDEDEEDEEFEDDFEEDGLVKDLQEAGGLRKVPATPAKVGTSQQTTDREKTLQFRYQVHLNKGALVQLHKEMQAFREFATKTFGEDATLVDRIKDGVESGKLTYYEVIMQVKRERDAALAEANPRPGLVSGMGSGNHLDEDDC